MGFIIDKITKSIEETKTGISYNTDVLEATKEDLKKVLKKNGWKFDWKKEFAKTNTKIYKLVLKGDEAIQGIMCIEPMDGFVEMHLIENAPHNYGSLSDLMGNHPAHSNGLCEMASECQIQYQSNN